MTRLAIAPLDRRSLAALGLLLLACFAVSAVGSAVTLPKIATWYETLRKPAFTPPNWVFGPVWAILYAAMAIAAWRIFRTGAGIGRRRAFAAFAGQLLLNLAWSFAFFGAESPLSGAVVIVSLEAAILVTIFFFSRLDGVAAWLLAPYAAWVGYATALNISILMLNRG